MASFIVVATRQSITERGFDVAIQTPIRARQFLDDLCKVSQFVDFVRCHLECILVGCLGGTGEAPQQCRELPSALLWRNLAARLGIQQHYFTLFPYKRCSCERRF